MIHHCKLRGDSKTPGKGLYGISWTLLLKDSSPVSHDKKLLLLAEGNRMLFSAIKFPEEVSACEMAARRSRASPSTVISVIICFAIATARGFPLISHSPEVFVTRSKAPDLSDISCIFEPPFPTTRAAWIPQLIRTAIWSQPAFKSKDELSWNGAKRTSGFPTSFILPVKMPSKPECLLDNTTNRASQ